MNEGHRRCTSGRCPHRLVSAVGAVTNRRFKHFKSNRRRARSDVKQQVNHILIVPATVIGEDHDGCALIGEENQISIHTEGATVFAITGMFSRLPVFNSQSVAAVAVA